MDKIRKNNSKKQELMKDKEKFYNSLPAVIRDTTVFDSLQNNHRKRLYAKLNTYFNPKKVNNTYFGWFHTPESIPAMGFDYITNVMRQCLTETINDILTEAKSKVAELSLVINNYEQYLNDNEHGTSTH